MKRAALAGMVLLAGIALAGGSGKPARPKAPARKAAAPRGDGGTPLEFGTLELNVRGTFTVYLDGRELGQTPVKPVKLLAGKHQLRLVSPEMGIDHVEEVQIRPRATSTLEIGFE